MSPKQTGSGALVAVDDQTQQRLRQCGRIAKALNSDWSIWEPHANIAQSFDNQFDWGKRVHWLPEGLTRPRLTRPPATADRDRRPVPAGPVERVVRARKTTHVLAATHRR